MSGQGTSSNVVGYARVSTREQDPTAQDQALREAGAHKIFTDHGASSRTAQRPGWVECLNYLRQGDTLLVWRLDRLAGSERMLIEIIHDLDKRGVQLRSLTEPEIDTTTPMGRALFGIVAVFAQLRVDTIRENTMAGLEKARAQGRVGGRPTVMTPERLQAAQDLKAQGHSLRKIGEILGVSKTAVYRALAKADDQAAR